MPEEGDITAKIVTGNSLIPSTVTKSKVLDEIKLHIH
jgi:hypothetical protein